MYRKTILLIEHDPSDSDLTRLALHRSRLRSELVVCRLGEQALDYLWGEGAFASRDSVELPALTLLNLELPKMPGIEVLRQIRRDPRSRRAVVVVLTASDDPKDIAACYDSGVNAYLRKPADSKMYIEVVQQICSYWLMLNETPRVR